MEPWHWWIGAVVLVVVVIGAFVWLIEATHPSISAYQPPLWQTVPVPPMRIRLQPNRRVRWRDPAYVENVQSLLAEQGFEPLGDFTSSELQTVAPDFRVVVFWHPQLCALAEIQQSAVESVTVEFASIDEAEQVYAVVVTNLFRLDEQPERNVLHLPEQKLGDALTALLQRRPASGLLQTLSAARYGELFERLYAAEMDWRMARGGLTADEVARIVAYEGAALTDELVEAVQTAWRIRFSEFLSAELRENFRREFHVADEEWKKIRCRLVFIHDKQLLWQAFQTWEPVYSTVYDPGDNEVYARRCDALRDEVADKTPREAFAQLNEKLGELRFQPYGEMNAPVAADVYLHPRGPDKGGFYLPA